MIYTKTDIKDCFEIYLRKPKHIIKHSPKLTEKDKIIKQWFRDEDVEKLSKTYGKSTSEIVNILENNGIL